MAVTINKSVLLGELKKFDLSSIQEEALKKAEKQINEMRGQVIRDFENHPVTKELENGADSENLSETLNGMGNLTTYIGFPPGSDPTEPIKNLLQGIKINSKSEKVIDGNSVSFKFEVVAPTIEEIESVGSLPFEQGQSWIKGIENGISGFGAYIYGKMFANSRSGKGLQSKKTFRQGTFKPVKYISEIMSNFYSKIKK